MSNDHPESPDHSDHPDHPDHPDVHPPGSTAGDGTEPTLPLGTARWSEAPSVGTRDQVPSPVTTTSPAAEREVHDGSERRQLSVGYLVTGLVFLGIAGLWLAREVGVVEVEDMNLLVPMLLVVVGAAGLLAGLLRAARRS